MDKKIPYMVTTPRGYLYELPDLTNKEPLNINLPYQEIIDIIESGLVDEATLEPLTPPTYACLVENLLGLLVDAHYIYHGIYDDDSFGEVCQTEASIAHEKLVKETAILLKIELPYEKVYNQILDVLPYGDINTAIEESEFANIAFKITEMLTAQAV